jgi:hypothetical protein
MNILNNLINEFPLIIQNTQQVAGIWLGKVVTFAAANPPLFVAISIIVAIGISFAIYKLCFQNKIASEITKSEKEIAEENKVVQDFGQDMLAVFGKDNFLKLPVLEWSSDWKGNLTPEIMRAPIMKGYYGDQPFLMLCCRRISRADESNPTQYANLTKVFFITFMKDKWISMSQDDFSIDEDAILNKIGRLYNYEPVGLMEIEGLNFVEHKPRNVTDLFLWDPTKTQEDNETFLSKKFQ